MGELLALSEVDRRRYEAGRLASLHLAEGPGDDDHPRNGDGARVVVPVADVDSVADLTDRVGRAGGSARVVFLDSAGELVSLDVAVVGVDR